MTNNLFTPTLHHSPNGNAVGDPMAIDDTEAAAAGLMDHEWAIWRLIGIIERPIQLSAEISSQIRIRRKNLHRILTRLAIENFVADRPVIDPNSSKAQSCQRRLPCRLRGVRSDDRINRQHLGRVVGMDRLPCPHQPLKNIEPGRGSHVRDNRPLSFERHFQSMKSGEALFQFGKNRPTRWQYC